MTAKEGINNFISSFLEHAGRDSLKKIISPKIKNISGLENIDNNIPELIKVDKTEWLAELELINDHYANFGDRLPDEMKKQHKGLTDRLKNA